MNDEKPRPPDETRLLTTRGASENSLQEPLIISGNAVDVTWGVPTWVETAAIAATSAAAIPYIEAIASELGKRTVERAASIRLRYNKRGIKAALIDVGGADREKKVTILLTGELSDEAHLALMDLRLDSDDYAGKVIYWSDATGAWTVHHRVSSRFGRLRRRLGRRRRVKT